MKHLHAGNQTDERLDLLLSMTQIRSDCIVGALRMHLVRGMSMEQAAELRDIPKANMSRALDKLEKVADAVEKVKEIDWERFVK